MVELDGKNEGDFAARRENESMAMFLARLVLRANPPDNAFKNMRDAARPPVEGVGAFALADELAFMRAHQAYGQFRQAGHAANLYLDLIANHEAWVKL